MRRGVSTVFLCALFSCAVSAQGSAKEALTELFSNLSNSSNRSLSPHLRFINLEELLDSSAEWRSAFKTLTPEDQQVLSDVFDELNRVFSHELLAVILEEPDCLNDEENCVISD